MSLASAFSKSVGSHPDKTAIFWGDSQVTFGSLLSQSRGLSTHLRDEYGVRPGDRVALWLKNCPEFVSAFFGILEAGAVVVPINNFLKPDEVSHILGDAEIDVIVTDQSQADVLPKLAASRPGLRGFLIEAIHDLSGSAIGGEPASDRAAHDLAVIIYTSGTTGHPKGAMLSHGNLLCNVESCRKVLAALDDDRFVILLPMFHSFMLCVGVLLPMIVGGSIVLIRSIHPAKNLIAEIIERQATILPAIPQFFRTLANTPITAPLPLRLCISGGAPLPVEILREFTERVAIPLIEGYGLSEASPVVALNPIQGPIKAGSIGLPIADVEVSIQDDAGKILPHGVTGEVCVRGGNVMLGYWKQPEETANAMRNGWLLTGDIGHQDEDGYFFITDRKKDMLLVNGINVYPREIEEVLYQIPGVKEAAVIGMPDPRRGEQPIAFVAAEEGVELEAKTLVEFVRNRLADYKVPKSIQFLPALPRTATGKILKSSLRQTLLTK